MTAALMESYLEAQERLKETRRELFEVMRNDMEVMAEFGDDEDKLSEELWTVDTQTLMEYADTYLATIESIV